MVMIIIDLMFIPLLLHQLFLSPKERKFMMKMEDEVVSHAKIHGLLVVEFQCARLGLHHSLASKETLNIFNKNLIIIWVAHHTYLQMGC